FSSCLPLVLQLPILIALYQVFVKALKNNGDLAGLYPFVKHPGAINPNFLHIINLSAPSIVLAIAAGLAQFWQSRMMASQNRSTDPTVKAMNVQTMYILPLISIFIAWRLPAGLPLYWIVTTLFAIGQQYFILRKPKAPAGA
ncbi:MAG TPA: YidC/Oxa1 family membrane protein insertase, partial [Patescibacteria group bacterium]|nr:YidC/Oxa1 family membrane protein insertase [Patescibacteria group bacterium]